jgi:DNA repair protein RadC
LFPEEELLRLASTSPATRREQLVREALAPYLSLTELRRLAAQGEDLHAALTGLEPLPEAVRALLTLLSLLLAPSHMESIRQPADIAALLMLRLGHLDHEEFWLTCLDTKNHVQRLVPLYKGSLNSSVVRVAEVFCLPMALNSASIIVAHSHPSGSTQASPEDIKVTKSLVKAGRLLQIEVLDHLIIARGSWLSMREHRLGW